MCYFSYSHPTFAAKNKKPTPGGDKKVGQSANHQKNNEETLLFSHSMLRCRLWRSKCSTTRWQEQSRIGASATAVRGTSKEPTEAVVTLRCEQQGDGSKPDVARLQGRVEVQDD